MSLLRNYISGLKKIAALPPGQFAVPPTGSFINSLGKQSAAEQVQGIQRGTSRMASESALANEKRDIRAAKRDVVPALAVSVANVGLQGLSTYDRMMMEKYQEIQDKLNQDKYDAILESINADPEKYRAVLEGKEPG